MNGSETRPEILTVVTRMNVGGPGRVVTTLAAHLPELGGIILAGRPGQDEGSLEAEAVAAGVRIVRVPGLTREISPLNDLRALLWLTRYLRRRRPLVVATHMAKAGTLARIASLLAGVPARVHTFHGHVLEGYFGKFASALFRTVERLLAARTEAILAVSPEIAAELRDLGITRRRIEVVRVGADLERLSGATGTLRAELALPTAPIVGFFGRLVPVKDPLLFVRVAGLVHRDHPQAHFVVIGDGELRAAATAAAESAGLGASISFLGFRSDIERVLPDLDLLLLTSRNEGTPLSVIEAAAAGVPTVATQVGGLVDIIRHGENGILTPAGDAPALAAAVGELLCDPGRRRRLGDAARQTVLERYDAGQVLLEMRKVYAAVLDTARRS